MTHMDEQTKETCYCRTTNRNDDEKKQMLNRLARIEGQIRGIRSMVEQDAYCPKILTQASAVTAAVNSFSRVLLAKHLQTCVADDIRQGRQDTMDELLETLQRMLK